MQGQHTSDINGSGDPARKDLLAIAAEFKIDDANEIVEEVIEAAGLWRTLSKEYGVSRTQTADISALIERMRSRLGTGATPRR